MAFVRDLEGVRATLRELVNSIDYSVASPAIQGFIRGQVERAKATGVVLGLSGGLDSSVSAFLAANALGKGNVLGLVMPDSHVTPLADVADARTVANTLGIETREIDVAPLHRCFMNALAADRLAEGNLRARIRMCLLYYHANLVGRLVLGTGDRSEALVGYFTKYGDGGVDLLPLAALYKTQVRELGRLLGVPTSVLQKKSSPRLWEGHDAEEELGLPYETLDPILYSLHDLQLSPSECARRLAIEEETVRKVAEMHIRSTHKRQFPPISRIDERGAPR